jgi:hypothetical protein
MSDNSRLITLTPILSGGIRVGTNGSNGSITVSENTTLTANNFLVFCDTIAASGNITITLGETTNQNIIYIIDSGGNSFTNNIIVQPASGTISGQSSITIQQNYTSLTIATNGTNYFVI